MVSTSNPTTVAAEPSERFTFDRPRDEREAIGLLDCYAECDAEIDRLIAAQKADIAAIGAKYAPYLSRLTAMNTARGLAIREWAEKNRKALAKGNTITIGVHRLSWRAGALSVALTATLDAVIATIRKKRWADSFLRTKEELNKEALLADLDRARRIDGIEIREGAESFSIKCNAAGAK